MNTKAIFCFFIFIIPSIYAGVAGVEFWPFSDYPMYSESYLKKNGKKYGVYVVDEKGQATILKDQALLPLDPGQLNKKIRNYEKQLNKEQKIRGLLIYYATRVKKGRTNSQYSNFKLFMASRKIQIRQNFRKKEKYLIIDEILIPEDRFE